MVWVIEDEGFDHIIDELNHQTDRGAVLMAMALFERQLESAIKSHLKNDKDITPKMFKGYGPLATLAAKIDLGLLLGLYLPRTHKFLNKAKDIRNEFAHEIEPLKFSTPTIRDRATNLMPDSDIKKLKALARTKKMPLLGDILKGRNTPRQRYLKFLKIQILQLASYVELRKRNAVRERGGQVPDKVTFYIAR